MDETSQDLAPFLHPAEIDRKRSFQRLAESEGSMPAPTVQQVEEAVAFIRQSAVRQVEYAQTIMDGAILAAEQVQDKRLELLEQGPEVSGLDIFIDFALTFALESPLAGKIFRALTVKMLTPRVRANQVAREKALRVIALKPGARLAGGRLTVPDRLAADQLAREIENLHRFEKALLDTSSERGPYPYVVAFTKAVRQVKDKERRPAPVLEPSDTPGVAILDLAQQQLSRKRLAIQIEHCMFELWVRTGRMSVDEAYKALDWGSMDTDGRAVSLAEVKDRWKRYFELLIWTLLLYERPLTGAYVTSPRQSFTLKGYVQPSLIEYWLKRFVDPETERPFSETPALKRPGGRSDINLAMPTLGNYMWRIAQAAVKNKVSLVSAGPLVPRKGLE